MTGRRRRRLATGRLARRWCRSLAALAIALTVAAAARAVAADRPPISLPGCSGAPALLDRLVEPRDLARQCGSDEGCWRGGLERAHALRDEHWSDYDAHRAYVLDVRAARKPLGPAVIEPVKAEYEALAARFPDHPAYLHLLGQLAVEGDAYRQLLDEIVAAHPDYPWAHLSRVYLARPGASPEVIAAAEVSAERFAAICPDRLSEITGTLEILGVSAATRPRLAELRAEAIERRDFGLLGRLWRLVRSSAPEVGVESPSAEISADLTLLERRGLPSDPAELSVLASAHRLAGDTVGRRRIEDRLFDLAPCSVEGSRARIDRFAEDFPDAAGMDLEDRGAASPAAIAFLDRALASCPDDVWALTRKLAVLRFAPPESDAALLEVVDRLVALGAERAAFAPWPELGLAELWLDRRTRLERVPDLLAGDEREAAAEREAAGESEANAPAAAVRARTRTRLAARYALETGDLKRAEALVAALDTELGSGPESAGAAAASVFEQRELDRLRAALDLTHGLPERALERLAPWLAEMPLGVALERDALAAWRAAHGDEQGFAAWRRSISRLAESAGPWQVVDEALPEGVALTDVTGASLDWRALRGRVVFVRSWASWCTACRDELPVLGELARAFAGRAGGVFVHVGVDREPSAIIGALAGNGLPFDALLGGHGLLDAFDRVPSSWIVDRDGRIVRRQTGPADAAGSWLAAARAALAAVAGPAPVEAPAE